MIRCFVGMEPAPVPVEELRERIRASESHERADRDLGQSRRHDVGAASVGLNITLPREQQPNPYLTPELSFQFRYFALRKLRDLGPDPPLVRKAEPIHLGVDRAKLTLIGAAGTFTGSPCPFRW